MRELNRLGANIYYTFVIVKPMSNHAVHFIKIKPQHIFSVNEMIILYNN